MLMKAEERRFAIGRSGDGKFSDGNLSNTGCHFIGSVYWPVLVKPLPTATQRKNAGGNAGPETMLEPRP
jgi:hypothetical protein